MRRGLYLTLTSLYLCYELENTKLNTNEEVGKAYIAKKNSNHDSTTRKTPTQTRRINSLPEKVIELQVNTMFLPLYPHSILLSGHYSYSVSI